MGLSFRNDPCIRISQSKIINGYGNRRQYFSTVVIVCYNRIAYLTRLFIKITKRKIKNMCTDPAKANYFSNLSSRTFTGEFIIKKAIIGSIRVVRQLHGLRIFNERFL